MKITALSRDVKLTRMAMGLFLWKVLIRFLAKIVRAKKMSRKFLGNNSLSNSILTPPLGLFKRMRWVGRAELVC